jgi:ATP-binding cassette subfamily F protein uup
VVSHDRYFLDRVCDRIIVFESPGVVTVNEGNYSYYREKGKAGEAVSSAVQTKPAKKKKVVSPDKASAPPKLKWKEERELETMEEVILEAEEALAATEAQLADPQFFVEHAEKAAQMAAGLEAQKAAIEALYTRWEKLESVRKNWEEWKAGS